MEKTWDPDEEDTTTIYKVVIDQKKQYQILPVNKKNPVGWSNVGKTGLKKDCLKYIEEVWTDRTSRILPRKR